MRQRALVLGPIKLPDEVSGESDFAVFEGACCTRLAGVGAIVGKGNVPVGTTQWKQAWHARSVLV